MKRDPTKVNSEAYADVVDFGRHAMLRTWCP